MFHVRIRPDTDHSNAQAYSVSAETGDSSLHGAVMSQALTPLTLRSSLVCGAIVALVATVSACASNPVVNTTASSATPTANAKIPITTASAEAKSFYLQALSITDQLRAHDGRVLFEQAVAKDPTFAMAHYNLALVATTPKVFSEQMNAAVAQSATVTEGERLLILALQARANVDQAKSLLYTQQLAAKFPRDERAHMALGLAYFAQQDYEKAAAEFMQAIEIAPGFSPAYNMLGYSYRPLGKNEQAEAAYKEYIRLIPSDPNPYDSYAELLMKTGRFDESIAQYEKALSLDPHFSGSFTGIAADLMFKGQHDQAIAKTQRLYDTARDDGERRTALFTQAVTDVDAGKPEGALRRLETEYALDATIADTAAMSADAVAMGDVLLDSGNPDAARAKFALARDLIATSSQSAKVKADTKLADRYNMARVALARHERATAATEAVAYASGAQANHNAVRTRQAHELAGLIALDERNFDLAATELKQANQQDPFVLYALARAYQGTGDAAKARTLALAAANANILPTLPFVFIRRKALKMVESLRSLSGDLSGSPSHPTGR